MTPRPVRVLTGLLIATAVATVAVETVNFSSAPEHGVGFAVRTGWALVRTLGWLILISQVRKGRATARPLSVILAMTTLFAVGRLIVSPSGLVGFGVLAMLWLTVVALLHRHRGIGAHLTHLPRRPVLTREGLSLREAPPGDPWVLTARLAAFSYSPLMLVPALVAAGTLGHRPEWAFPVILWILAGIAVSYVALLSAFLLARGSGRARRTLVSVTIAVLLFDLPLCRLLLGTDGLIRDGAPLVAAAALTLYALRRAAASPRVLLDDHC
ncbi:hypothetical protein ACWT_4392 [Actinoplanes sp. SE50]|uniref:hypothetical protein n=1 Tax=unclassified Actinoplanes TaxID=2626549 RepID=UPI00023ECB4A|nr:MULTISPECIES: hypothetical protein [unclassified Actinoplanes]AEV85412.1 hypothetical protein ACPL_4521 [Actinoplanes sp. SE50/110]ATO83807.1 hypothetical protein ACWT_4392 [Actinoplanes sp. SE50]SLM01215.1 hypothetical protein ACSP50_4451 [Actinoplanes sp. SE50/110]